MLGQMAAGLAHEVKNRSAPSRAPPLWVIRAISSGSDGRARVRRHIWKKSKGWIGCRLGARLRPPSKGELGAVDLNAVVVGPSRCCF